MSHATEDKNDHHHAFPVACSVPFFIEHFTRDLQIREFMGSV